MSNRLYCWNHSILNRGILSYATDMTLTESDSFNFTIFVDGACPICSREAKLLMKRDKNKRIRFVDTSETGFDAAKFGISTDPNRVIHGLMKDGTIVYGVEVFRQVYKELGLGWLLAPTAWPILKPIFDACYLVFAKNRIAIGRFFGRSCDTQNCKVD